MIFTKTFTVPASTVKSTPLVIPWTLVKGLFYQFELFFPPGPSGLVGVKLVQSSHSVYPADDDEWFLGDNLLVSFPDEYDFQLESKQVEIVCYNIDTVYDHTLQMRIGIITDPAIIKSKFGFASLDTLILQMQALIAVLQVSALASGKYDTSMMADL